MYFVFFPALYFRRKALDRHNTNEYYPAKLDYERDNFVTTYKRRTAKRFMSPDVLEEAGDDIN